MATERTDEICKLKGRVMARNKTSSEHNHSGNCWDDDCAYKCSLCGAGNLCDVCHSHDMPRGECEDCPACPGCDDANEEDSDD